MILHQFNAKNCKKIFPIFSSLLHWQSIIPPSYDTSQHAILFTNSILIPQKKLLKSNQNQWICDGFTTSWRSTGSLLPKFRKTCWIFSIIAISAPHLLRRQQTRLARWVIQQELSHARTRARHTHLSLSSSASSILEHVLGSPVQRHAMPHFTSALAQEHPRARCFSCSGSICCA